MTDVENNDEYFDIVKDIYDLSETELEIDELMLDEELRKTPKLFTKWQRRLNTEALKLAKLIDKRDILNRELHLYFQGKGTPEVNKRKGSFPYSIPKLDIPKFTEADTEWININGLVNAQRQRVKFIEGCINQINQRQHIIREMINWRKFQAGEF